MPTNRLHHPIVIARLIVPLLLAIGLLPWLSASGNTAPTLRCRFSNPQIPLAGPSQLQLILTNVQGVRVNNLSVTVRHNDGINRYIDPIPSPWFVAADLLPISVSEAPIANGVTLNVTAEADENVPLTVNEGVLARAPIQAKNESGLVEFTLIINSSAITAANGTAATLAVNPGNCFLAIGEMQIPSTPSSPVSSIAPTATPTPTFTSTATSTPIVTATSTTGPAPTQTFTPSFTPTQSPTLTPTLAATPTATFTPTATPVPVVLSTPTPRGGIGDVQSPLPTPAIVAPLVSGGVEQTPDIAATLTVEAQATLIDFSEEIVLEPLLETPVSSAASTPGPTQTPALERLSPPQLDATETPVPAAVNTAITSLEETTSTPTPGLLALNPESEAPAERLQVQVEQPPAATVIQRRPLYSILSWVAFVGAVVLVFTSWWLRREP